MSAEFEQDPAKGFCATCCEVRQWIWWSKDSDSHNYPARRGRPAETWSEDRDTSDKRYGHRAGVHSEEIDINKYTDDAGRDALLCGTKYHGEDTPSRPEPGVSKFKLSVIDVCNGDVEKAVTDVIEVPAKEPGK